MITKILWEAFSVALLLYGSYLIYVFIWFSIVRIWEIDTTTAKLSSGLIVGIILLYSFIKWFIKKRKELMKEEAV